MQTMADQLQRQQQTFQQMMQEQVSSYIQLLNILPFYVSSQPQGRGQNATGEIFHQASKQWMELAQKQQQTFRRMIEQAVEQQQTFQNIVQESLNAYMDFFKPTR